MRKNYFVKIVEYMKNFCNIEENLNKLTDDRKAPTFKTSPVVLLVLLGFILRVRSFNELNNMIIDEEFTKVMPKRTKLPKIDAIKDTLKVVDLTKLKKILRDIIHKARENKVFDMGTMDGLVVAAIDEAQIFNCDKKSCDNCLRARKDIENSKFFNLKTECGLEHCFLHGGNAIEAVLCLIYIASNFIQLFYHRRIKQALKTQVDLIRQLVKGLYKLKFNPEIVINTG